jgi:hypothetical protein
MAEPVEVAIDKALIERAKAFAAAQSPALTISLPNVAFTPPTESQTAKWLRATFLPAPSFEVGVAFNAHVQHYGIFQIDVFHGIGAGEYAPGRIASDVIKCFPRGLRLAQDGTSTLINRAPYRGSLLKDGSWTMIPVSIPYLCFARPA